MNYLMNIYISRKFSAYCMVGNFIGDRIKAVQYDDYPEELRKGILINHKIHEFAEKSTAFSRSRSRLKPVYGKYSFRLVSIFYDHFLAAEWNRFNGVPLNTIVWESHFILEEYLRFIPFKLGLMLPGLFKKKKLINLSTISGLHEFMKFSTKNANLPSNLHASVEDLIQHYEFFKNDFEEFMAELNIYAEEICSDNESETKNVARSLYVRATEVFKMFV